MHCRRIRHGRARNTGKDNRLDNVDVAQTASEVTDARTKEIDDLSGDTTPGHQLTSQEEKYDTRKVDISQTGGQTRSDDRHWHKATEHHCKQHSSQKKRSEDRNPDHQRGNQNRQHEDYFCSHSYASL